MCRHFKLTNEDAISFLKKHEFKPIDFHYIEVRPQDLALTIKKDNNRLTTSLKKFGFSIKSGLLVNLRFETISSKEYYFESFKKRRCLLPATTYYEIDKKGVEQSFSSSTPFFLAGIYQYERFVLLTVKADENVSFYHSRMPLVFEEKEAFQYLDLPVGDNLHERIKNLKRAKVFALNSSEQLPLF